MPHNPQQTPSLVVIYGDEEFQKQSLLQETLDALFPPGVDRSMALTQFDGTRPEDDGGPSYAAIADDLATLPFLADRRVVVVREADKFISASREKLERWVAAAPPTATLILECRTFPKNTNLYKAAAGAGATMRECKKLGGGALADFVVRETQARGKQIDKTTAFRLTDLVGQEQGMLANEVEKLALYIGERPSITPSDIDALVGLSREEKIFAAVDAAAAGRLAQAVTLWRQVLATDKDSVYRAVGGVAFKLRAYLTAQKMAAEGAAPSQIAFRYGLFGRDAGNVQNLLRRLPARRVAALLAKLAELDAQAKQGLRSIEAGVERLLVALSAAA